MIDLWTDDDWRMFFDILNRARAGYGYAMHLDRVGLACVPVLERARDLMRGGMAADVAHPRAIMEALVTQVRGTAWMEGDDE